MQQETPPHIRTLQIAKTSMTLVMHICRNISLQAIRQNPLPKESQILIGLQEVYYVQTVESTAHG